MGYDDAGQPTTTSFADYLMPTATEVPGIESFYRSSPSPLNPLGVKGAGEAGVIPCAAAVISAVGNAPRTFGGPLAPRAPFPYQPLQIVEFGRTKGGGVLGGF